MDNRVSIRKVSCKLSFPDPQHRPEITRYSMNLAIPHPAANQEPSTLGSFAGQKRLCLVNLQPDDANWFYQTTLC